MFSYLETCFPRVTVSLLCRLQAVSKIHVQIYPYLINEGRRNWPTLGKAQQPNRDSRATCDEILIPALPRCATFRDCLHDILFDFFFCLAAEYIIVSLGQKKVEFYSVGMTESYVRLPGGKKSVQNVWQTTPDSCPPLSDHLKKTSAGKRCNHANVRWFELESITCTFSRRIEMKYCV